jgi:hypothetical protein
VTVRASETETSAGYRHAMVIESSDRPLAERLAVCDGCGRRLLLRRAGLVEDGAVLCASCAHLDVEVDVDPPTQT